MEKTVLLFALIALSAPFSATLFVNRALANAPQVAYNRYEALTMDRQLTGDCPAGDPDPCNKGIPAIFFDCDACDQMYLRQSIQFVNHVRDKEAADVHVLITNLRTGSGGQAYTINYIGRGRFADLQQTLLYNTIQNDTAEEVRRGLSHQIMLGLMPYMARTTLGSKIQIDFDDSEAIEAQPVDDPWNFWVFRINGNGYVSSEASRDIFQYSSSVSADRVTEEMRIQTQVYGNRDLRRFKDEGETIESNSQQAGAWASFVRSLTDHWSLGVSGSTNTSSFNNIDLGVSTGPALEYNIYPYDESTRREFTFAYRLSYIYQDYAEPTIFEKEEESLLRHSLEARLRLKETWGETNARVLGSQYMHDPSKNRIEVSGNVSVRLTRGLSVRLASGLEFIHDQLYLPKGETDLEDLLLQRRQLATTYGFTSSVGLSYTFGSIYNNVVNTRL